MTQILFRENKFWIDGMEILNPVLIDMWYDDRLGIHLGKRSEWNKVLLPEDTFPLPENLSYEIETMPSITVMGQSFKNKKGGKKVIRLKRNEMKNEKKEIQLSNYAYQIDMAKRDRDKAELKVFDLEAQLVKAKEIQSLSDKIIDLMCDSITTIYDGAKKTDARIGLKESGKLEILFKQLDTLIKKYKSTNEVKEKSPQQESEQQ